MKDKGFTPAPIKIKQKLNKQLVLEVYPRTNCNKTNVKPQLVRGLTLMEILVSTFLIVLTLTGLIHLFVAGKRLVMHGHSKMTAGEIGKVFLDPLQWYVRQGESSGGAQDGWDQNNNNLRETGVGTPRYCNSVGGNPQQQNCPTQADRTLSSIEYSARYDISSDVPLVPNMRKVVTTITWTENPP